MGSSVSNHYLDEGSRHSPRQRWIRLRRAIRALKPDIVVSHSALPNLYSRAAAPPRMPVVTVLHSAGDDFQDWRLRVSERILQTRRGGVVSVSQSQASVYRTHFPRVQPVVIANGVRDALPVRSSRGLGRPVEVVSISRIADQKNPRLWIDVCGELDPSLFSLTWYGPIDLNGLLAPDTVMSYRAQNPSRMPGPIEDVGAAMIEADILFSSSDREALSVGLLEGAAVGIPIVCSDSVAATLPCYLPVSTFAAGDAHAAATALQQVAASYDSFQRSAVLASSRVREEFSADSAARKYVALFEQLTEV
ncbi:glycosyltransferase [Curtobacterium sp. RRHDQ10]|uniref:glycosyltransferase n=1 Tax=Curtobacterium phyllosphaerae TaxID=3413379 RepID=UPI003BF445E5